MRRRGYSNRFSLLSDGGQQVYVQKKQKQTCAVDIKQTAYRMLAVVMKTTTAASQLTTLACVVLSCLVCATSAIGQSSLHTDVSTFPW